MQVLEPPSNGPQSYDSDVATEVGIVSKGIEEFESLVTDDHSATAELQAFRNAYMDKIRESFRKRASRGQNKVIDDMVKKHHKEMQTSKDTINSLTKQLQDVQEQLNRDSNNKGGKIDIDERHQAIETENEVLSTKHVVLLSELGIKRQRIDEQNAMIESLKATLAEREEELEIVRRESDEELKALHEKVDHIMDRGRSKERRESTPITNAITNFTRTTPTSPGPSDERRHSLSVLGLVVNKQRNEIKSLKEIIQKMESDKAIDALKGPQNVELVENHLNAVSEQETNESERASSYSIYSSKSQSRSSEEITNTIKNTVSETLKVQMEQNEKDFSAMMNQVKEEKEQIHQQYKQQIKEMEQRHAESMKQAIERVNSSRESETYTEEEVEELRSTIKLLNHQLELKREQEQEQEAAKAVEEVRERYQEKMRDMREELDRTRREERNSRRILKKEMQEEIELLENTLKHNEDIFRRSSQLLEAKVVQQELECERLSVVNDDLVRNVDEFRYENYELKDTLDEIKKETKRLLAFTD